ncbi:PBECR4 domain-containing protein [Butyrivibrio sp. WCE2006]|uniref:PBECR4 domain-containing protein n=1 Tax=Butyrivibrio sp. WCE2006 TaxID=1410611 RepID=UPI000A4FFB55|nr:PBECR4 domain-containing protein [Butyrivibrio sp. WCE2006]
MNLLKQAALSFERLKEIRYRIVLSAGLKKPLEEIEINFYDEDLFHILGLQHLSDIDIPKNKKKIISQILNGKITDEYLQNSEYYADQQGYNIKHRIELAGYLEEYLDSDNFTVAIYKLQHGNRTFIRADYLITCKRVNSDEEYYIFIRKRSGQDYYGIVSCFARTNTSYWGGKRYLMLKEKIEGVGKTEQFRHPNYKE